MKLSILPESKHVTSWIDIGRAGQREFEVYEWCDKGDLRSHLKKKHKEGLDEASAIKYFE